MRRGIDRRLVHRVVDELPFHAYGMLRRFVLVPAMRRSLRRGEDLHCLRAYAESRCIFVHIPKAAGTSISTSLFGGVSTHFSAQEYRAIYGAEAFATFFKFTVVRNPWDRLHSAFCFLKQGGNCERDRAWAQRHLARFDEFNAFVLGWLSPRNIHKFIHFVPQHEFVCDRDGRLMVDLVGRFETMDRDLEEVARRLKRQTDRPRLNATEKADYRTVYGEQAKARVAEVYGRDVEMFGYTFAS